MSRAGLGRSAITVEGHVLHAGRPGRAAAAFTPGPEVPPPPPPPPASRRQEVHAQPE